MKKLALLFLVLLLFVAVTPLCAQNLTKEQPIYLHDVIYEGSFKTYQLYNRSEIKRIWYESKRPRTVDQLVCSEANTRLLSIGVWVGNLSDDGKCLGYAEAPEWTSGNYLNFLSSI